VEANVPVGSWGCAEEVQVGKVEDEAEHAGPVSEIGGGGNDFGMVALGRQVRLLGRNCGCRTFCVWAWVRSRLENRLDITVQLKRAMARQHLQLRHGHDGEF